MSAQDGDAIISLITVLVYWLILGTGMATMGAWMVWRYVKERDAWRNEIEEIRLVVDTNITKAFNDIAQVVGELGPLVKNTNDVVHEIAEKIGRSKRGLE